MISKMTLIGFAAAMALMQATAADAATLNWSFSATGGLAGAGAFIANRDNIDPAIFHVTSATGTIGGDAVTLSLYDGADNKAFPTSPYVINSDGIGFSTVSGFYNIYEYFTGLLDASYDCGSHYCLEGPNAFSDAAKNLSAIPNLSITVSSIPEPATWGLMLAGLGGLGAALRCRRTLAAA
jgi:hypothetical protein